MNRYITYLIFLFVPVSYAFYCGDIRSAGCIQYCLQMKCEYGYCPLDYKDTLSDCKCLSCSQKSYDQLDMNENSYTKPHYLRNADDYKNKDVYKNIEHPNYKVSQDYLDYKVKQFEEYNKNFPDQYQCTDVDCYKKMKETLTKVHENHNY